MRRVALAALVVVTLVAQPAVARSPEDLANEISSKVMSPYCPGVTLHDCPSEEALDLRDDIEVYAREGMSESAIMDRLESDFGPSIRGEPSSEGAGILAWILPSMAVLAGVGVAWVLVLRWFSRRDGDGDREPRQRRVSSSPDERELLDTELRRLRQQS